MRPHWAMSSSWMPFHWSMPVRPAFRWTSSCQYHWMRAASTSPVGVSALYSSIFGGRPSLPE